MTDEKTKRVGKSQLLEQLKKKLEAEGVKLTGVEASKAINAVFDSVAALMEAEGKVNISGFGTFVVVQTRPKTGRNPQSGEPVQVPAKLRPKFRPAQQLQKSIAESKK